MMPQHKGQRPAGSETATEATRVRRRRHWRGHAAEAVAAALLILQGHWILARRARTTAGEIDLVAIRGRRLAFVEVKARRTIADAEAAISPRQRERVRRAAALWLARRPRYQDRDIAFDVVFVLPWRLPLHIRDGL